MYVCMYVCIICRFVIPHIRLNRAPEQCGRICTFSNNQSDPESIHEDRPRELRVTSIWLLGFPRSSTWQSGKLQNFPYGSYRGS